MPALEANNQDNNMFKNILEKFDELIKEPQEYLTVQPTKLEDIHSILHQVYQHSTGHDEANKKTVEILPELVLEDMDEEQIWQQLELRNNVVIPQVITETAKILAMREENFEIRLDEGEGNEENVEGEEDDDDALNENGFGNGLNTNEDLDDDLDGEEEEEEEDEEMDEFSSMSKPQKKRKLRSSVVDDKFFKLSEMEEFLEVEDAKEFRKQKGKPVVEEDGIDYFADDLGDADEDEEDGNVNYNDFFDGDDEAGAALDFADYGEGESKGKKFKDHFAEDNEEAENGENDESMGEEEYEGDEREDDIDNDDEDDDENLEDTEGKKKRKLGNEAVGISPASDSESDSDENRDGEEDKPKSSFELREERLRARIHEYEEGRLGEKPWHMKGEVQATDRPQNSVLEEVLEFESTTRPAPVITEATTRTLEEIIKQRIKDQAWDDVERKARPVQTPQEYRKQLVLDQEKSKESLAQVYEKEYQRELDKLNPNRDENTEEESKEHKDIRQAMRTLFIKLDALSNFHFTPKPVAPEAKIITNTPAIAMEEVAPVAVSDANLLAPEEVFRKAKHELQGKSERSRTDKNRDRRKKKQKQRAVHKALEEKDLRRQKMGIPLAKKEEKAKLLKSITKHRNVQKINIADGDNKALKSSKAFFSKLQDSTKATAKISKKKTDAKTMTAKQLKL